MKKINPLYFLALLITVLLISISSIKNLKQELNDELISLKELEQKANIYKSYKNEWQKKSVVQKKINKIKNIALFKNEKIKVDVLSSSLKITFDSVNRNKQNSFLNMILNDSFIIKSMNFTKDKLVIEVSVK